MGQQKELYSYITFVLREPKGNKPTPIVGIIRFNDDHLKVPTGFVIHPNDWDKSKGRPKTKQSIKNVSYIIRHLKELEEAANTIVTNFKAHRVTITKEALKLRIKEYYDMKSPQPVTTESGLFKFIESFIKNSPERVNINNGKRVERRTIQKYQTVFNTIKEFGAVCNRRIDFDTIDITFYDAFVTYLTINQGFSVNNVGKYIQTLKVFLNEAASKGINVKQDYRSSRFKVIREDSDSIYLNTNELNQLYQLDLTNNKRLEKVRDLFLVGCYTGLRFSDLTNLRPEFINGEVIRLEQLKTKDEVVIPCHPVVSFMLKKYNNELPVGISNQKMNDYLKELGELAGFNSIETKNITKGGKRLSIKLKKYEMISTHTARRSFATNMYWLGIPSFTIMKITGHRTEKAFMRYIKLDKEEHAKIIAERWRNAYVNAGN